MTAKFFVDTNVLVYAASSAAEDKARRDVAHLGLELLDRSDLRAVGLACVLAEFYAVATSKSKLNLPHDDAVVACLNSRLVARIPACPITRELVMNAVDLRHRFGISYWDAAIIMAAKQMGCQTLYSEDLNHGQDYDGVTVVNPFTTVTP